MTWRAIKWVRLPGSGGRAVAADSDIAMKVSQ